MTNYDEQNLSPEEQRKFDALPRHRMPPHSLEEKIMTELKNRELITPAPSAGWSWMAKIAAAVVLLVLGGTGGYFAGKSNSQAAEHQHKNPLYVLLLHEPPGEPENVADLVAEYSQWAGGIYSSGRYITGEKLRGTGRILTKSHGELNVTESARISESMMMGGYFVIEAKDYNEAVKIASECPHLKYGGTIELREIEPT